MDDVKRKKIDYIAEDKSLDESIDDCFLSKKDNYFNYKLFADIASLDRDEEYILFSKLKMGDKSVVERIVLHNLKYVYFISRNYTSDPYLLDELFQQGCYGLMKALKTFDYKKGFRFSTYASYSIKKYIIEFFQNYNLIRISRDDYKELKKLNKKITKLENILKRKVTEKEISEYTGYSIDRIREIRKRKLTFIPLEKNTGYEDSLNDIDYYNRNISIRIDIVSDIVNQLKDEKNQFVLKKYLGIDDGIEYTFQQIGKMLGISKQAVKKRYDKSITEIREMLKEDYDK
ncbi:MAG: sigma-70 family RNA polymerase sigma factor [Erysipelotrichaceae bacterium]